MQLFGSDAMLTGKTSAQAVNIFICFLMEFFNINVPFFFRQVLAAHAYMEVTVSCMAQHHNFKGIMVPHGFYMFDGLGNFIDRNHKVISNGYISQNTQGFLAVTAQAPQSVVCFQHF